jgi:hypothetical protein
MKLKDKICIITGGGRRLGRDFAFALRAKAIAMQVFGPCPTMPVTAQHPPDSHNFAWLKAWRIAFP